MFGGDRHGLGADMVKKSGKKKTGEVKDGVLLILRNRRLRHDYEVIRTYEAGMVLSGSEVKSLRAGDVQWGDAHGVIEDGEAWLYGLHIAEYRQATYNNHTPQAKRKLLLNRHEIDQIAGAVKTKGFTLKPAQLHLRRGRVKIEICLVRGKDKSDKKRDMISREKDRDIERALARRR